MSMKPGLSLRMSQHLALTPQLQQSIRLLQLSTLELSQEVEQMLDDNPFLELDHEASERESYGLDQADTRTSTGDHLSEISADKGVDHEPDSTVQSDEPDWSGDGTVEWSADDSEWCGDAPARQHDEDKASATELARSQEDLYAYLLRQSLSLRLSPEDQAALRYLIESLNEDGYLEDSLESLAQALAGNDDLETLD